MSSAARPSLRRLEPLDAAKREARVGEEMLWAGRPLGKSWRGEAIGRFVFGVAFGGFALLWTTIAYYAVSDAEDGSFMVYLFPLFGVPFLFVGFGMLYSTATVARRLMSTVYALSNQRFLILTDWPRYAACSVELATVTAVKKLPKGDGAGSLVLVHTGEGAPRETFAGVPGVASVGDQLEQMRLKLRGREPTAAKA
jgi:hypothetical protein